MGISKPSQGWAKHQKDMAVLYFACQKDMAVLYFALKRYGCPVFLFKKIWLSCISILYFLLALDVDCKLTISSSLKQCNLVTTTLALN